MESKKLEINIFTETGDNFSYRVEDDGVTFTVPKNTDKDALPDNILEMVFNYMEVYHSDERLKDVFVMSVKITEDILEEVLKK